MLQLSRLLLQRLLYMTYFDGYYTYYRNKLNCNTNLVYIMHVAFVCTYYW